MSSVACDAVPSRDYTTLTVSIEAGVAQVWLNRPDSANAMNAPMWQELDHCFRTLDAAEHVRVVILGGKGRHFCAGIDLAMLKALHSDGEAGRRAERLRHKILELQANLSSIEQCRKPVLAAIHGACVGGGVDIIACCDMRYATESARFSIKEIDVGLVADVGSLQRLPHFIGEGLVRELAYTGREMRADEAVRVGLVNRSFDDTEAMHSAVRDIAATIASKSPLAIRGIKQTLDYGRSHGVEDALNYVATWNSAMLSFADIDTALNASKSASAADFDD